MNNIFSVDTEDWFHANYDGTFFTDELKLKSTVEQNVDTFLHCFEESDCKATFFVLGSVAEDYPDMIRKIAASGHEIASHGYGHGLVYKQTPEEFKEDIHKSKSILEDIIGKPVLGYRAPSWSITNESLWALDILVDEGFKYDSSIFPTKNFLYGIPDAPRFFYKPTVNGKILDILEIPPSTMRFASRNIPFSGGFYFRAMPFYFIDKFTSIINKSGNQVLFYLHPREIDPSQPRLKLSKRDELIHYFGIDGCLNKLLKVITKYKTTSIADSFFKKEAVILQ